MPVTKYFPRIWSSPKQKDQIFFKCDPALQRPLRVGCICRPSPPPPLPPKNLYITTIAGNGSAGYENDSLGIVAINTKLNYPSGVAVDSSGNVYIADTGNNRIRKVTKSTGIITTIAGNGDLGYNGDGGAATSASLNGPNGVAVDSSGNVYIADTYNNCIRKVGLDGNITTIVGNGTFGYNGDGILASTAWLSFPSGVAVDSSGNVYIADTYEQRIRKVDKDTNIITTVAGNGGFGGYDGDGVDATSTSLNGPNGVDVDSSGNVYIADTGNNRIRKVTKSTGIITTIAGNSAVGYNGDGGAATSASLNGPNGVAVDSSGNVYIADTGNNRIRKVGLDGKITTIAGNGISGYYSDGILATSASIGGPFGVVVDSSGNVYISDVGNQRIGKLYYA